MPRESCIEHPKRSRYFAIREDFLNLFEQDYCAAAVVAVLEFRTNLELRDTADEDPDRTVWLNISLADLTSAMLGLYSIRSIRSAVGYLAHHKVIQTKEQARIGDLKEYLLQYPLLNQSIKSRSSFSHVSYEEKLHLDAPTSVGKIADEDYKGSVGSNVAETVQKCGKTVTEIADGSKEEKEVQVETEPDPPSPSLELQPQNQNNTPCELKTLVWAYQRAKGTGKVCKHERDDLEMWLGNREEGETEVLGALGLFLADEFWKERHFPLYGFRSQFTKYLERFQSSATASIPEAAPAPAAPVATPRVSPTPELGQGPQTGSGTPQRPFSLRDYLEAWNIALPSHTEPIDPRVSAKNGLAEVLADPEFREKLPKVLLRAGEVLKQHPDADWLDAFWILKGEHDTGRPNWKKLLKSGFMRPAKSKSESRADSAQATINAAKAGLKVNGVSDGRT